MRIDIDVDASGVIRALDRLGAAVDRHLLEAARVTAGRIRDEARGRVARRTGQTAAAIVAEEARDGRGYVVYVKTEPAVPANLDIWLEFGTQHMTERPFLRVSALLEEEPHRRRIERAIEAALAEVS